MIRTGKITGIKRLKNGPSGTPRFSITFYDRGMDHPREFATRADAQVNHTILDTMIGKEAEFFVTDTALITKITILS